MENYEKVCDIGKGSFGAVSKIKRKADGKTLVWKELNYGKMSEKEKQQLVSEVNILRELRHPNIVRYYDRIIDKESSKIFIIMEFCEKGDMAQLIKKLKRDKEFLPEDFIWKILAQVTLALYDCHRRKEGKILHRDLKPGNVFLDAHNNVKLGDFGLSRIMGDQSVFAYTHVGTPYYMSPEQISEQRYNEKSDIWSAGCVMYEIAALRAPFEATNQIQLAMKIKAGKIDKIPGQYSDELFRVIQWMMSLEKEKRPSVEDLMVHPQICYRLRDRRLKEMQSNIKRKEEDLVKKEKLVKDKEAEIDRQVKEVEEKERQLQELEERLLKRQAIIGSEKATPTHKVEPVIVEQSPRIPHRSDSRNGRRPQGTSQSRDSLPSQREPKYLENNNGKNKDIYYSNDNFSSAKALAAKNHNYLNKYEEDKKDNIQVPPLSYRKAQAQKEAAERAGGAKPPILRQPSYQDKVGNIENTGQGDAGIELQRKKLAMLRAGYTSNQEARHSRQSSRDRQQNGYYTGTSANSSTNIMGTTGKEGTFLKPRNDLSANRRSKDYMPVRQPSANSSSSKSLRNALEEITSKIQNKYLS